MISALIAALVFVHSAATQGPQNSRTRTPEKCKVEDKEPNAPEYKVGRAWPTGTKPSEIYLLISIEPEEFTKPKIVALAHQLKKDFCKETRFGAIIFDDFKAARHVTYLSNTRDLEKAQRGFYHIDRAKNEEYVQFSTARSKPRDEVRIDLTKEP
jgi:hypothetical protein